VTRIFFIIYFAVIQYGLFAQTTIEEISYRLDSQPYYDIWLDYNRKIIIPDSIKLKMLSALKRELPKHFADSVFELQDVVLENITKSAWQKCENDTVCFDEEYRKAYENTLQSRKKFYYNKCYSNSLILACGSWDIKESIPYLEKELKREYCIKFGDSIYIEMALASLNDSIKQVLIDRYTLSNVLENSQLDTIDNNAPIYKFKYPWSYDVGLKTAIYLKNKDMILNILDLIYIKGIGVFRIGSDDYYNPRVSYFVQGFCEFEDFRNFFNYKEFEQQCMNYVYAIWTLSEKTQLNEKEKKELERLLSTEYRTIIRNQMRDWLIENVEI
jgi:hypothetical protein